MKKLSEKLKKGQSLVELALFLPLFLVIVGGLVEVGQFLVIKNRIDTAANLAARFGANGGQNDGMANVALNSVTQTLTIDENQWDIWAFRGQVNELGTEIDPSTFEYEHVYGNENTVLFPNFENQGTDLRQAVYDELVSTEIEGGTDQERIQNVQFAGTLVVYDADSILNLNTVLSDVYSVQALHVMRTFPSSDATNGCSAFPIVIERGNRSLSPEGLPAAGDYWYPKDGLTVDDFPGYDYEGEPGRNEALYNLPLDENARPGALYFFKEGSGSGNFGWVRWNEGSNANEGNLVDNLEWPGRSTDYGNNGANGKAVDGSGYSYPVYGYIEPGDPTDQALHVGDRIPGTTGVKNSNAANTVLEDHIKRGRALRFIVYDLDEATGTGSNAEYVVYGFVVLRLHGYNLTGGSDSWILGEFVSWDTSCGQQTSLPTFGN